MIMRFVRSARLLAATVHRRAHEFHGLGQALEHRLADQKMADVELDDLRQRGDRLRGRIIEPVARMHFQADACGEQRAVADQLPLGIGFAGFGLR